MRKNSLGLLYMVLLLAFTGCHSKIEAVVAEMQKIRNAEPLPVTPPPTFRPVANYIFDAYQLKSPFVPSSVANELSIMAGKRVYPNFSRPPQPLESYALEDLFMKGVMRNAAGGIVALIHTPDGQIEQIHKGSYMGRNLGRVIAISPNQIDLLEVVPDGQEGYIERPRTLILRSDAL
jgi:type IV pilus assembly protein PilP